MSRERVLVSIQFEVSIFAEEPTKQVGVMILEYWSVGVMFWKSMFFSTHHYSITPILQYSK